MPTIDSLCFGLISHYVCIHPLVIVDHWCLPSLQTCDDGSPSSSRAPSCRSFTAPSSGTYVQLITARCPSRRTLTTDWPFTTSSDRWPFGPRWCSWSPTFGRRGTRWRVTSRIDYLADGFTSFPRYPSMSIYPSAPSPFFVSLSSRDFTPTNQKGDRSVLTSGDLHNKDSHSEIAHMSSFEKKKKKQKIKHVELEWLSLKDKIRLPGEFHRLMYHLSITLSRFYSIVEYWNRRD